MDAFTFGLDVKPDSSMVITSTLGNVRVGPCCTCNLLLPKCFPLWEALVERIRPLAFGWLLSVGRHSAH